jgi:hypothetical protein
MVQPENAMIDQAQKHHMNDFPTKDVSSCRQVMTEGQNHPRG